MHFDVAIWHERALRWPPVCSTLSDEQPATDVDLEPDMSIWIHVSTKGRRLDQVDKCAHRNIQRPLPPDDRFVRHPGYGLSRHLGYDAAKPQIARRSTRLILSSARRAGTSPQD
jgi:hypothetical protein